MIKQWRNSNLGVIYFHLPNSKNDEILTSDGVMIPFSEFKTMSTEMYNSKKNSNGGYDYYLSLKSEKLVKKTIHNTSIKTETTDIFSLSNEQKSNENKKVVKTIVKPKTEENVETVKKITKIKKPIKTETTQIEKKNIQKEISNKIEKMNLSEINKKDLEKKKEEKSINDNIEKDTSQSKGLILNNFPIKIEDKKPKEIIKNNTSDKQIENNVIETQENIIPKKQFNLFDWAYPKIMILITLICSTLSVYFTATYLRRLQNIILSYAISLSMLLYGLIGFQIARRKQREKKHKQAFVYYTTSIVVILFSMLSSIDVNYSKYKIHHADEEITYNTNDGVRMSYDILKQELEDNKEIISNAQKDIEFQQTQWVLAWDNELGKNVLLEGRISATAQEKIKEDNQRIEELTLRNKEINAKLIEYAQSGITMNKEEGNLEKSKSLTDLLGILLGLSGDLIQLIFLLVPSFFIDIIGVLSLSIFVDKYEKE